MGMRRRHVIVLGVLPALPAAATPATLDAAIRAFVGDAALADGRVAIEIAELVENGNTVPISVTLQRPAGASERLQSLALFTERNPQPEVAVFHFSRHAGRERVDTRMRLATSQRIVAVARMDDGRCWRQQVDVIVTLAACVES